MYDISNMSNKYPIYQIYPINPIHIQYTLLFQNQATLFVPRPIWEAEYAGSAALFRTLTHVLMNEVRLQWKEDILHWKCDKNKP